jgi:hypothetical protein
LWAGHAGDGLLRTYVLPPSLTGAVLSLFPSKYPSRAVSVVDLQTSICLWFVHECAVLHFRFCSSTIPEIRSADRTNWTEWGSSTALSFIRFKYFRFSSLGNLKTTDCSTEVSDVQYLRQGMYNGFQTGISQRARQSMVRCATPYIEALTGHVEHFI